MPHRFFLLPSSPAALSPPDVAAPIAARRRRALHRRLLSLAPLLLQICRRSHTAAANPLLLLRFFLHRRRRPMPHRAAAKSQGSRTLALAARRRCRRPTRTKAPFPSRTPSSTPPHLLALGPRLRKLLPGSKGRRNREDWCGAAARKNQIKRELGLQSEV